MRVNSELIKLLRRKKAWSQEQLAEVSGLGLRTIQRIETGNSASFETVKSVCAALEITVDELIVEKSKNPFSGKYRSKVKAITGASLTVLVSLGAIILGTQSFADQIMLDIEIVLNNDRQETGSLLTRHGKTAEMRLDEELRFVVVPTIEDDGRILLTTKVFKYQNSAFVLIGEPKLLIKNDHEAEIRMEMDDGDQVRFHITPHAD